MQRAHEGVEKEKDVYKNLKKSITAVQNEKNARLRALEEHANQLLHCEGEINNLMNEKRVLFEQLEGGKNVLKLLCNVCLLEWVIYTLLLLFGVASKFDKIICLKMLF